MAVDPDFYEHLVLWVGPFLGLIALGSYASVRLARKATTRRLVIEINLYLWAMFLGIIGAAVLTAHGVLSKATYEHVAYMFTGTAIGASVVTLVKALPFLKADEPGNPPVQPTGGLS